MKSEEPKIIGIERKKNEKFSQQIIMVNGGIMSQADLCSKRNQTNSIIKLSTLG